MLHTFHQPRKIIFTCNDIFFVIVSRFEIKEYRKYRQSISELSILILKNLPNISLAEVVSTYSGNYGQSYDRSEGCGEER